MKKLILGFAFLLVVIPCEARIITVDDDGPANFNNIQAAIDDSNDGDTVIVADGIYTGPGNRDTDFLGKAITLRSENGPGNCIMDCNGTETEPHRGPCFHSREGPNSMVSGITVKNGWAAVGAGIYCNGASPTVDQCIILSNTVRHHGGGIYCETSNAIITNCVLRYNKATQGHGGGIFCLRSNPSINTCIITYNSAGSSGGGLFNNNSNPVLIDCQITKNAAGHCGGAICNTNGSVPVQTGCTHYDNRAGYLGSELYNHLDTKHDQTATKEALENKNSDNSTPTSFAAYSSAHIYYVNGGCGNDDWTGLSQECTGPNGPKRTIQAAINDSNDGDTIIIYPNIYYEYLLIQSKDISLRSVDPCDLHIVETTIVDGGGGNTVLKISDANAVIDGLTVANGSADPNGGGIYSENCNLMVSECIITGNRTVDGKVLVDDWPEYTFTDGGDGGGIYCSNSSAMVTNCIITQNITGNGGPGPESEGGDGGDGGGIYCSSSSIEMQDCEITHNSTGSGVGNGGVDGTDGGNGAGICAVSNSSIEIENCIISSNNTGHGGGGWDAWGGNGGNGGGIYCFYSSATIMDCMITGNRTGNGLWGDYGLGGNGGSGAGICAMFGGSLIINNCVISRNTTGYGGDGQCYGWPADGGDGGDGAGIFCSSARVMNCTIADNSTGSGGSSSSDERGSGGDGGRGAGIFGTSGDSLIITNCTVDKNATGGGGNGSCYSYSNPPAGGPVDGGNGGDGAGIFCSSARVMNCTIADNSTGSGGEGYDGGSGGDGGRGAGIFGTSGDSLIIANCTVAKNTTGGGGGRYGSEWPTDGGDGGDGAGIFCSSAQVTNCTIANNSTGSGGEGYDGGSNGSWGKGAGICAKSDSVVTNSIIWGNSPDQLTGHDCGNVTYCDIGDSLCGGSKGDISTDPLFADSSNGDYHLKSEVGRWDGSAQSWVCDQTTSPCIDAGDPNSDWTAELWPHGRWINMGAYGGTPEASMSPSSVGNAADLNYNDDVNFVDYALFANQWYGGNSYTIPRGSVVVDGNISEWSENVEWIALDKVYSSNPNDVVEARFALKWNESTNKIYVAVIVEDFNHVFRDDYGTWKASDRLELYSQGDSAGGNYWTNQDIAQQYIIAPDTNGGSWATLGFGEPNIIGTDLEYTVKVDGNLIIYEAGVKQFDNYGGLSGGETIVTNLHAGRVVRFDVVADTRWSDTGFGMLSENTMLQKFKNADHIAQYTLVEQSERPPCLELKTDLDRNCMVNFSDLIIFCENWLWQ